VANVYVVAPFFVNKMSMISFLLCITSSRAQNFNRANFPYGGATVNLEWTANALAGQSIPGSNLAPDVRECTDRNDWAITYDDGPGPETGRVLQELRQRQIKATFFVVGRQIMDDPDHLRQAYADGHEIALHSW